jgi:hypothetical protein
MSTRFMAFRLSLEASSSLVSGLVSCVQLADGLVFGEVSNHSANSSAHAKCALPLLSAHS